MTTITPNLDVYNKVTSFINEFNTKDDYELEAKYIHKNTLLYNTIKNIISYYRSIGFTLEEQIRLDIFTKNGYRISTINDEINKYVSGELKKVDVIQKIRNESVIYSDFNMDIKIDLSQEKKINYVDNDLFVNYRLKKMFSLTDKEKIYRIDISIVKSSKSLNDIETKNDEYELELELLKKNTKTSLFFTAIVELYSIISEEEFPITKNEVYQVLNDYKKLTGTDKFVGPQPVTLMRDNLVDTLINGGKNILKNYTVTDKADGERALLFINSEGIGYFINNRMDVKKSEYRSTKYFNTLLDGEKLDKFMAFDIYFYNKNQVYKLPLIGNKDSDKNTRNYKMKEVVDNINCGEKEFYYNNNIYALCIEQLNENNMKKSGYKTDGLIFTPRYKPVFGDKDELKGGTWDDVFKWKPPHENTIDFLVKKDLNHEFRYELYVGYNLAKYTPLTSYEYVKDQISINNKNYYTIKYFANSDITKCKNNDIIEPESIVEYSYNVETEIWEPLRVRYDKTELYRKKGISGTANDYKTATSIMETILFPVTEEMLTGEIILTEKDINFNDDVYYNRQISRDKSAALNMMKFHNQIIKNKVLLSRFKESKRTLCDISMGKGGDINKWLDNDFTTVLGIDVSRDNIENPVNGAYSRLLNNTRYNPSKYKYIFVVLDSSRKFNEDYFETLDTPDKIVIDMLMGKNDLNEKYNSILLNKFNIVSCMFSIHYFFKNETSLNNVAWNINMLLKPGGCFVGTAMNGKEVKKRLINNNDELISKIDDKIIWRIRNININKNNPNTIDYDENINVYLESIGKEIAEPLFDINMLTKKLSVYNIILDNWGSFKDMYEDSYNMNDDQKSFSFMNIWFIYKKAY